MQAIPLIVENLSVIRGGKTLLNDVSLRVEPGELVVIVGPNGAGKSTLLGAILGWIAASSGRVSIGGTPLSGLSGLERAERVGWLPQTGGLAEPVSVLDQVMAARFRFRESRSRRSEAALVALDEVGLKHFAERDGTTLSGGEAQRVGLAALIAQETSCWLLDEPANHLDPAVQHQVMEVVLSAWRGGRAVVVVTHDPDRILARLSGESARIVGLADGAQRFDLDSADDALPAALGELYGVGVQRVVVSGRPRFVFEVPQ